MAKHKFPCAKCKKLFANPPKLAQHYREKPSHQSEKSRKLAAQKKVKRESGSKWRGSQRLPTVQTATQAGIASSKPTTKFCTQCGTRRATVHRFCGVCGGKL